MRFNSYFRLTTSELTACTTAGIQGCRALSRLLAPGADIRVLRRCGFCPIAADQLRRSSSSSSIPIAEAHGARNLLLANLPSSVRSSIHHQAWGRQGQVVTPSPLSPSAAAAPLLLRHSCAPHHSAATLPLPQGRAAAARRTSSLSSSPALSLTGNLDLRSARAHRLVVIAHRRLPIARRPSSSSSSSSPDHRHRPPRAIISTRLGNHHHRRRRRPSSIGTGTRSTST